MSTHQQRLGPHLIAGALAFATLVAACKRPQVDGGEQEENTVKNKPAAVAAEEGGPSFLDPLLGTPWLGHANDGALVSLEFFHDAKTSTNLCRSKLTGAYDFSATRKSPFTADEELAMLTWDGGKGQGSYDHETETVKVSIASAMGTHHALLRQVSAETHPELVSFRTAIPDDEPTRAANQQFVAMLANGAPWWESVASWDKVQAAGEIAAGGGDLVLIRPAGDDPIRFPKPEPGGRVGVPLVCHLPPGTTLTDEQSVVGVVTELHYADQTRSTWSLARLNRGAITQQLDAQWMADQAAPPPAGKATLYLYFCRANTQAQAGADGANPQPSVNFNQPISNLLQLEVEIDN